MTLTTEAAQTTLNAVNAKLGELKAFFTEQAAPFIKVRDKIQDWLWVNGEHTADSLVEEYVALRDRRAAIKAEYDAEDKKLKDRMELHEAKLLEMLQETGAESFRTAHGTAYTQLKVKSSCSDWTVFWAYIRDTGRFDLLEKRVGQTAIKTMVDAGEELPPGINTFTEREVTVRRA